MIQASSNISCNKKVYAKKYNKKPFKKQGYSRKNPEKHVNI